MAFFVSGAIIGAGILGAGASIYASNKQSDAANKALDFQQQQFAANQPRFQAASDAFGNAKTENTAAFQPYMDVGKGATYTLGQLTGSNGTGGNAPDYSTFFKDPSYQFAQQQGELGIERGANARGLNLSGGTLRDLATFNSGLASQQYGNYFSRLMGLSQLGANAAGNFASNNTNIASGLGNLATGQANANNSSAATIGSTMQGVGQAQASGAVGVANAASGGINNTLLYNYLNKNPSGYSGSSSMGSPGWGSPLMGGGTPSGL